MTDEVLTERQMEEMDGKAVPLSLGGDGNRSSQGAKSQPTCL